MLRRAGVVASELQEATIPGLAAADDELWPYLDRALYGMEGNRYSYTCRKSVSESLRGRIVVKDVRMQFNFAAVNARYGIPVVHIQRNPHAVVSSLLGTSWRWNFHEVRLAEVAGKAYAELEEFDTDALSRITAYWALTERSVEAALRSRSWAHIVAYRDIVAAPAHVVSELCAFIRCRQCREPDFEVPSSSYFTSAKDQPVRHIPRNWREQFTSGEIDRIRAIVERLYPAYVFDLS